MTLILVSNQVVSMFISGKQHVHFKISSYHPSIDFVPFITLFPSNQKLEVGWPWNEHIYVAHHTCLTGVT